LDYGWIRFDKKDDKKERSNFHVSQRDTRINPDLKHFLGEKYGSQVINLALHYFPFFKGIKPKKPNFSDKK